MSVPPVVVDTLDAARQRFEEAQAEAIRLRDAARLAGREAHRKAARWLVAMQAATAGDQAAKRAWQAYTEDLRAAGFAPPDTRPGSI